MNDEVFWATSTSTASVYKLTRDLPPMKARIAAPMSSKTDQRIHANLLRRLSMDIFVPFELSGGKR